MAVPNSVTWNDIVPGAIIRYRHVSRARRLADKPMLVRTGRIENVYPPEAGVRTGQISVSALNKDGSVNQSLGRFNVPIDFIESVTRPNGSTVRVPSRVQARDEPCADPATCDVHRAAAAPNRCATCPGTCRSRLDCIGQPVTGTAPKPSGGER